jgi:ADP-ribose pyrophosphatase YjhB (NUDIX family)
MSESILGKRDIFPAKELVLGFPVVGRNVLLSKRKRTPWEGCLSGLGGNVEKSDLSNLHALQREARQEAEIEIKFSDMRKVAQFEVYCQGKEMKLLSVYLILNFRGDPTETEEMGPHMYCPIDSLLIRQMVSGDEVWVERILNGESLMGKIYRSANAEELISIEVWPCAPFLKAA